MVICEIHIWLYNEFNKEINKHGVFSSWSNSRDPATMYRKEQIDAQWLESTYAQCPFFLDYPHGKYPKEETDQYEEATKSQK